MRLQATAAEGREGTDSTGVREDGNASVLGTCGPAQQTIHLTVRKGACSIFHTQFDALLLCRIVTVAKSPTFYLTGMSAAKCESKDSPGGRTA